MLTSVAIFLMAFLQDHGTMVRGSCRCCENCEIFQGKKLSICIAEPASGILWDAEILHKMAALVKSTLEPIAKFDIDFR